MGTTTDWVSSEANAPPAKLAMAEAAEAFGASRLAGSEAHVLVISRVVRYIYSMHTLVSMSETQPLQKVCAHFGIVVCMVGVKWFSKELTSHSLLQLKPKLLPCAFLAV